MNIGIIGCGAIGSTLAKAAEAIEEIEDVFVFDKSHVCSRVMEEKLDKAKSVLTVEELLAHSDFIIEAASQEAVRLFARQILENGRDLLIMSIGALVDEQLRNDLERTARKNGAKIFLPTGAICGIDGLNSAAVSGIESVNLVTAKPPEAFRGVPFIEEHSIDLENLTEPVTVFEGTAQEAVRTFPKNINVAATVSLAGIGFDRTKVTLIADPTLKQNRHTIIASGEFGSMKAEISNLPFDRNPKTSRIAAQSAIAALKKMVGTYWIGV